MAYKYTYPVVDRALRNFLVFVLLLLAVVVVVAVMGDTVGADTMAGDSLPLFREMGVEDDDVMGAPVYESLDGCSGSGLGFDFDSHRSVIRVRDQEQRLGIMSDEHYGIQEVEFVVGEESETNETNETPTSNLKPALIEGLINA